MTVEIKPRYLKSTFKLEVTQIGAAFQAEMMLFGDQFHAIGYQAGSKVELENDFLLFKSGFIKLQKILAKGNEGFVPMEQRIFLKEARIMSGIHPAILAERMGVTQECLKRREEGVATEDEDMTYDQAYIHFISTYVQGLKMDWVDWSLEQQKEKA